jgi:hypothetical protein
MRLLFLHRNATGGLTRFGSLYNLFTVRVYLCLSSGDAAMADEDRRLNGERRSGKDRRDGLDTRSDEQKRLVGERRLNRDRRSGLDRRSNTEESVPVTETDRLKPTPGASEA